MPCTSACCCDNATDEYFTGLLTNTTPLTWDTLHEMKKKKQEGYFIVVFIRGYSTLAIVSEELMNTLTQDLKSSVKWSLLD